MMVLVTYDVNTQSPEGCARLRRIANICKDYGQRVQCSVFECIVDPAQAVQLESKLVEIMNEDEDSLRFYNLGSGYASKIKHFGAKKPIDLDGSLIFRLTESEHSCSG